MKRYIKASFDNEVPSWLIANKGALKALSRKGVDLKKAVFSREKSAGRGADYVIYKLPSKGGFGYESIIYIPDVYNDDERYMNPYTNDYSDLSRIAKKRLAEIAEDIVYVNKANSAKAYREHYEDPRYEKGKYMGQTWGELPNKGSLSKYSGHRYGWSKSGKVGGDYLKKVQHDKSGYAIPDPKDRLARFYGTSAGLDSVARKVEKIYDELLDLKEDIFSVDFTDFGVDYDGNKYPASCTYGNMLSRFGNATREYRLLLDTISDLKADGKVSRFTVSSIMDRIKSIDYSVKDVRRALETQRD